MAEERPSPASPVCYLDEVADAYAGYLSMEECQTLIRRWRAQASRPDIAARLAALLPALPPSPGQTLDPVQLARLPDIELQAEIRHTLPKCRDDSLHRALSEIADLL